MYHECGRGCTVCFAMNVHPAVFRLRLHQSEVPTVRGRQFLAQFWHTFGTLSAPKWHLARPYLRRATVTHHIIRRSKRKAFMREEAAITINGARLTDAESMTVRVAIDTLANVLTTGLGLKKGEGIELTDRYIDSLSRIKTLLENREARKQ